MSTPISGYETTYILKTEITDVAAKALQDKLNGIVEKFGGEVVISETWGRRKLAYRIQKEVRGLYQFMGYSGKPGVVAEIERNLRINESVIRFLSVAKTDEFEKEQFLKDYNTFKTKKQEGETARIEAREAAAAARSERMMNA